MKLNMNRVLIVVFLMFFALQTQAQLKKTKVKLVLNNGDEKFGYAKRHRSDIYLYKKRKKSKEKEVFSLASIKSISYVMKEGYREFNYLKKEGSDKYRLMIPLIKGKVNLYKSFEKENMSKINNNSDNSYRVSKDGITYHVFKNFKKEAIQFFSDCEILVDRISSRELSRLDLAEIVVIYNDECIEVKKDKIYKEPQKTKPIDSLGNTLKIKIPEYLLQEKIVKIVRDKAMINLKPIYFNLDKATITPESLLELNKVIKLMNRFPKIKIQVGSHTDSRGPKAYNMNLSSARANSVVKVITNEGIALDRIEAIGFGETQPVNKCTDNVRCTEAAYEKNRRTEFVILNPEELD